MEIFLIYLRVFLVGGIICTIGQLLLIKTKITSGRILVLFVVMGAVLEAVGLYDYIVEFGKAGALIPITGFGRSLARGAIIGVKEMGILGIFTGGLSAVAAGITCAIVSAYLFGLLFSSKTKD